MNWELLLLLLTLFVRKQPVSGARPTIRTSWPVSSIVTILSLLEEFNQYKSAIVLYPTDLCSHRLVYCCAKGAKPPASSNIAHIRSNLGRMSASSSSWETMGSCVPCLALYSLIRSHSAAVADEFVVFIPHPVCVVSQYCTLPTMKIRLGLTDDDREIFTSVGGVDQNATHFPKTFLRAHIHVKVIWPLQAQL